MEKVVNILLSLLTLTVFIQCASSHVSKNKRNPATLSEQTKTKHLPPLTHKSKFIGKWQLVKINSNPPTDAEFIEFKEIGSFVDEFENQKKEKIVGNYKIEDQTLILYQENVEEMTSTFQFSDNDQTLLLTTYDGVGPKKKKIILRLKKIK